VRSSAPKATRCFGSTRFKSGALENWLSDKNNARIEHNKALKRVMNGVLKDDAEQQFSDNPDFRRW
jgi:hypothetical protein